MILVSFKAA